MKISQQLTLVLKNGPSEICGRQPLKTAQSLNSIFWRLSSTIFTWSILEYFVPLVGKKWFCSFCNYCIVSLKPEWFLSKANVPLKAFDTNWHVDKIALSKMFDGVLSTPLKVKAQILQMSEAAICRCSSKLGFLKRYCPPKKASSFIFSTEKPSTNMRGEIRIAVPCNIVHYSAQTKA